jgi:hypothetical protein
VLLRQSGYRLTGPIGRQDLGAVPVTSQIGLLAVMAGVVYFAVKYKK